MRSLVSKEEIKRLVKAERMEKIKSMAREIVVREAKNTHEQDIENITKRALKKAASFYDTCERINFDELPRIVYKKGE